MPVGPFFPRFPPGLTLEIQWAGDIVVEASVGPNPFVGGDVDAPDSSPLLRPFVRALTEPVPIAELELARVPTSAGWRTRFWRTDSTLCNDGARKHGRSRGWDDESLDDGMGLRAGAGQSGSFGG